MVKALKRVWTVVFWTVVLAGLPLIGAASIYSYQVYELNNTGPMDIKCVGTTCRIDIGRSINEPETFDSVGKLLESLDSNYTVVFVLKGNGGRVDGALQLISYIKSTKAKVIGEVTGDVYSAHAFITAVMPKVEWKTNALFMLHASSNLNMAEMLCAANQGVDRGLDARLKCIENTTAVTSIYNKQLFKVVDPILTDSEKQSMLEGHDLYLSTEDVKERFNNRGVK